MPGDNLRFILRSMGHAAILPVLFVLHNMKSVFPFFDLSEFLGFLLIQLLIACSVGVIMYWLVRKSDKAILLTYLFLGVYFFFAPAHQLLKTFGENALVSRYSFVLPVLAVMVAAVSAFIWRSRKTFSSLISYLALVLFIFIGMDLVAMVYKSLQPIASGTVTVSTRHQLPANTCDTCAKPDIYLLVFDEYANSSSLLQEFGYDNGSFDKFLEQEQFRVLKQSHSNYYYTLFCMASMLNMSYLESGSRAKLTFEDVNSARNLIKYSSVIEALQNLGYDVLNYSAFDLPSHPRTINFTHAKGPTETLKQNLIHNRVWNDIGWNFRKNSDTTEAGAYMQSALDAYTVTENGVRNASAVKAAAPRFIYGHFFAPHSPFLFDSAGNRRSAKKIEGDSSSAEFIKAYLNYLPYVNRKIAELITTIKKNSSGKSLIIVMGDHGLRVEDYHRAQPYYFKNLNAIYFPKPYTADKLNDSISGVNQFRAVFNELFRMNLPYDRDTICNWGNEQISKY